MKKSLLSFSLVWFSLSIICSLFLTDASESTHAALVVLTTISYILCIYSWIKLGNRVVSIFSFFVAYSFICNCAQPLLYIFNVPTEVLNTYALLSVREVSYSLRFQFLCIAALNIGVCLALKKSDNRVSTEQMVSWYNQQNSIANKTDKILFKVFLITTVGSLFAAYKLATVRSSMSYHEYMYEGMAEVVTYFYFQYFFCFLGLRFVFKKQHTSLIYLSWFFFICLYMALGLRSAAMPYIAMFVATLPVTHSKLFKKKLLPLYVVGTFAMIILMGVISATRTEEKVDFSALDRNQGLAASFYWSITDMGSPGKTLGMTMKMCDREGLRHQSILYSVATVIPRRVLRLPVPGDTDEALVSPGSYLAHKANMPGYGFSYLAESYYNLGWFGWIFVLLYGMLIVWMENSAYNDIMNGKSFFKITFLLFLARQIFFARGDFCLSEAYLQYMAYTAIIYKLLFPKLKLF